MASGGNGPDMWIGITILWHAQDKLNRELKRMRRRAGFIPALLKGERRT